MNIEALLKDLDWDKAEKVLAWNENEENAIEGVFLFLEPNEGETCRYLILPKDSKGLFYAHWFKNIKPLPKEEPLTPEEIKEALLGEVVEFNGENEINFKGVFGCLDQHILGNCFTVGSEKYHISELKYITKFRNPSNRFEWLEPTRENFKKCGLSK